MNARMNNEFYSLHVLITAGYIEQPFRTWMHDLADAIADDATEVPVVRHPIYPVEA